MSKKIGIPKPITKDRKGKTYHIVKDGKPIQVTPEVFNKYRKEEHDGR